MSLNISDFNLFFFLKIATTSPEKSHPLFSSNPLLSWGPVKPPPPFWKFGWRFNPPSPLPAPPTEREGVQVNNRNTRKRCELCSKLTIKTAEQCQWRYSGVFNFKHISHLFLLLPLLTLKMLAGNAFVTYFFIIKE